MPRIAITCGDPAGVGPEVAARWLAEQNGLGPDEVVLIGYDHWIRQHRPSSSSPVVSVGDPDFVPRPGKPSREGARIALEALEAAAAGAREGRFPAVVTGPVSKKWLQQVGFTHPGQTEFFEDAWGGKATMAFAGRRMRVVLATWHCPLGEVPLRLDRRVLERAIRNGVAWMRAVGMDAPRIAVCGLNPHAGEGGLLGTEEYDWIDPFLNDLRPEFPGLSACLPGDTVFWRHLQGEFDLVLALYHDQGLAPLKALEFEEAVNLTLGCPYVRTSPDHGTAYSLAGTGKARVESFANAVEWALRLAEARFSG